MGIFITQDETDQRLLLNYTHDALTAMGATLEEVMKALKRMEDTDAELPRSLSANFFKTAVMTLRAKNKQRQQEANETRETTEEEKREGVQLFYEKYIIGGNTWHHYSAGCAWIARYLGLDVKPFMEKAKATVAAQLRDEGMAKGLRAFVADIEPDKITAEAQRMAVKAHFRERYDREQCKS